jgi:hypothetical protein
MSKQAAQPADEATENILATGPPETAAGVTATVRAGRRETLSSAGQHDAR